MTEREYIRLYEHIRAMTADGDIFLSPAPQLSQERFELIWNRISEGEAKPSGFDDFVAAANRVKVRLFEYVKEEGPFVFENGRCFLINVPAFELEDWQWPRIPIRDVTDIAQKAFRTEFERDPKAYFRNHRLELGTLAIGILLLLTVLYFAR